MADAELRNGGRGDKMEETNVEDKVVANDGIAKNEEVEREKMTDEAKAKGQMEPEREEFIHEEAPLFRQQWSEYGMTGETSAPGLPATQSHQRKDKEDSPVISVLLKEKF